MGEVHKSETFRLVYLHKCRLGNRIFGLDRDMMTPAFLYTIIKYHKKIKIFF